MQPVGDVRDVGDEGGIECGRGSQITGHTRVIKLLAETNYSIPVTSHRPLPPPLTVE